MPETLRRSWGAWWGRAAPVLAATLLTGGAVSMAWWYLERHETAHYAEMLEWESYATRSDLVKDLEVQISALRAVAAYWNDYGRLSPEEWDSDAQIELSHFHGIDLIVWHDPGFDVRYATSAGEGFDLRRRPTDEQWRELAPMLEGVRGDAGAVMLGPVRDDDGGLRYRVQVPARGPGASGVLVASVDADAQLAGLLGERSPGYAVAVSWDGQQLFQRGTPAESVPETWTRSGLIELSLGPLWRVTHVPGEELVASLSRPAMPWLLAAGWLIALLIGSLVFQMGRVRERALAAERAERRYAELNVELERKVAERTEELADLTEDLETLNQSVSHDIRGPMNTITLNARLLEETAVDVPRPMLDAIGRMSRALGQMQQVVDRLDAYSTVTFMAFSRSSVDMRAAAERAWQQLVSPDRGVRGAELDVGALPSSQAQPLLVEILWHNLISNALKYSSDHAAPRVEIGAEPGSPTIYYVRDNGVGFEAHQADEIFRPFARLPGSQDGQGLGLAIVSRIVRRHRGAVWADATPGHGATFYFHLGEESAVTEAVAVADPALQAAVENVP